VRRERIGGLEVRRWTAANIKYHAQRSRLQNSKMRAHFSENKRRIGVASQAESAASAAVPPAPARWRQASRRGIALAWQRKLSFPWDDLRVMQARSSD